jgi:hypothetical protein
MDNVQNCDSYINVPLTQTQISFQSQNSFQTRKILHVPEKDLLQRSSIL